MRIIAYTYEADVHCPECARERFRHDTTLRNPRTKDMYDTGRDDGNGVGLDAIDREGNLIHPVYDIDENEFTHCGDCGGELK
jgi:hypothetical protein